MPTKLVTKLITFSLKSYQRLVTRLENKWADSHPSSFRNYTTFKSGVHSTLLDVNDLLRLWTKLTFENRSLLETVPTLSQRELYVLRQNLSTVCRPNAISSHSGCSWYSVTLVAHESFNFIFPIDVFIRQVPRDLLQASPVLLLTPLPGTVFLLPIFFAYPHVFLNRAFWTEEQRITYDTKHLRRRFTLPPKLLVCGLHRKAEELKKSPGLSDTTIKQLCALEELCKQFGSTKLPLHRELIPVAPLFENQLAIDKLDKVHVFNLCRLHDLPVRIRFSAFNRWPCLRTYLEPNYFHYRRLYLLQLRAALILSEDRLIHRELIQSSGVVSPPPSDLRDFCIVRGIDVNANTTEEAWDRLKQWIALSLSTSDSNHSFRLHLPLFLEQKLPTSLM